ncbi:MAG: condensation domain-containing protein, partial [Gammaproteobacteria bacterium]
MSESNANIESIYPLSPLQQGLLFHTLHAPESGAYREQMSCRLKGNLNVAVFKQAWGQVVQRHAVLRTLFVWRHRKKLLQVVRGRVTLPWVEEDWRGWASGEQCGRLAAWLEADRARGF